MAFMRAEKYTWPVSILQSHKPSLDPRAAIAYRSSLSRSPVSAARRARSCFSICASISLNASISTPISPPVRRSARTE